MALTFNHATKQIGVPQLDAQPLLIQTLVNAAREEEASERGIVYEPIIVASGKETLKSGVTTGITAALLSTWSISFESGAYQASIDGGNLADALARVVNTGSPQVLVLASAASTITAASGSTLAPTAEQNATAVWNHTAGAQIAARMAEAWGRLGLDPGKPLVTNQTTITFGDIVMTLSGDATSTTVTRT